MWILLLFRVGLELLSCPLVGRFGTLLGLNSPDCIVDGTISVWLCHLLEFIICFYFGFLRISCTACFFWYIDLAVVKMTCCYAELVHRFLVLRIGRYPFNYNPIWALMIISSKVWVVGSEASSSIGLVNFSYIEICCVLLFDALLRLISFVVKFNGFERLIRIYDYLSCSLILVLSLFDFLALPFISLQCAWAMLLVFHKFFIQVYPFSGSKTVEIGNFNDFLSNI